jgi:hypothetical protein
MVVVTAGVSRPLAGGDLVSERAVALPSRGRRIGLVDAGVVGAVVVVQTAWFALLGAVLLRVVLG